MYFGTPKTMNSLAQYLTQNLPKFTLFNTPHLVVLTLTAGVAIALPKWANKNLNTQQKERLGLGLSLMVLSSYVVWILLESVAGTFKVQEHLPFHLCRIVALTLPVTLWLKKDWMFQISFFWGLSATLLATVTPHIEANFPHFYFWRYMVAHPGIVITTVYAAAALGYAPTKKGLWNAFVALNVLLVFTAFINYWLNANYFWICAKPPAQTLLSHLGPWPWYLIWAEGIALFNFFAAWWLYQWFSSKNQTKVADQLPQ